MAGKLEDAYSELISRYRGLIRDTIAEYGGKEIDSAGDGFFIVFDHATDAAKAVIDMQRKIAITVWPEQMEIFVRIGIHAGEAMMTESGFTGLAVHKAARICDAAHGGQVLISNDMANDLEGAEIDRLELKNLGKYHLKGFETPVGIFQLSAAETGRKFPAPRAVPALPVVAVLPFRDELNKPENAYFFDGISTDMIQSLSRITGLRVVARAASSAFQGSEEDVYEIGEKLNANAVLHGTMKKEDHRISLHAELTDIDQEEVKWTADFDGDLDDLFRIEEEIVRKTAQQLGTQYREGTHMKKGPQFRVQNIEAYDYYLKGRRFYYQFSRQSILFALQMFQKAIQIDPDFALAYTGAANCYAYLYMYEDPSVSNRQAAEQFSQKAIELSPSLAEAHTCRGVTLSLSKDFDGAEECFEKAIALDPKLFEAYYHYARMSFANGNLQKAAGLFRDANRVRPEDYQSLLLAAQCFEKTGFDARAREVREDGVQIVEEHLKLNPGDTRALYMGANGQAALGNSMVAIQWLQRALFLEPNDPMLLYNAGCIYALMGMEDEALESLDQSVEAGLTQKEWFEHDPDLNGLRDHPRFREILLKLDDAVPSGKKPDEEG